jgi:menaquinone-dependent protoporphyrinogen oxidase
MSRVLIVYATSHGQTQAVAEAIASRLRGGGHVVELASADAGVSRLPPPADYDAVVLGSRIQFGRHAPAIGEYVHAHRAALFDVATAFFSVSLSAAQRGAGTDPNGYVRRWCEAHAWYPMRWTAIAGALRYPQYGRALRVVMKLLARAGGHATDTSREHVYTDWPKVAAFADAIAADLTPRVEVVEAADAAPGAPSPRFRSLPC